MCIKLCVEKIYGRKYQKYNSKSQCEDCDNYFQNEFLICLPQAPQVRNIPFQQFLVPILLKLLSKFK